MTFVANCRDIFFPVPFPPSPFGFRRNFQRCSLRRISSKMSSQNLDVTTHKMVVQVSFPMPTGASWADPGVLWKNAPRAIRGMRGKSLQTVPFQGISTVLWVHQKLPQSTVGQAFPSNKSYESKAGCNRTPATVLWVPLEQVNVSLHSSAGIVWCCINLIGCKWQGGGFLCELLSHNGTPP